MIRTIFKSVCLKALEKRANCAKPQQMERSAVVFSPHYDDETLGVGGTILKKRRCGAEVYLVFMTDGSRSHARVMDGARLAALRRAEAIKAAKVLGVEESHVRFLNFPETNLQQSRVEAMHRVVALLQEFRCPQVYVPSTREPLLWSADHRVTTEIVFRALSHGRDRPEVFEYPVWFWYHWPWVPSSGNSNARQLFQLSVRGFFGLAALKHFNTYVPIADVQQEKRLALDQHASQMVRLRQDVPWPVLGEVSQGEFLKQFFGAHEFFSSRHYRGELNLSMA